MEKILISGCLIGHKVRYHGGDAFCNNSIINLWQEEGRIISICPEVSAGLPIPRPSCEIVGGTAKDVFSGKAKILSHNGIDRTNSFIDGANLTLFLAKKHKIKMAILKRNSPSCGSGTVYDGTFTGKIVEGMGITAYLLNKNGIKIFDELKIQEANVYLKDLES